MRGIETLVPVDDQSRGAAVRTGPALLAPDVPGRGLGHHEHAARRALRRQIAKLEHDLSRAIVEDLQAGARGRVEARAAEGAGARLLTLGDLEARRDDLVARLAAVEARRTEELHNRVLLREMYRDPASYKHARLRTSDLAERGCRVYEVVPRFGVVGILGGWWRVKVSSGCPLPSGAPAPSSSAGGEARHTDGRPPGPPVRRSLPGSGGRT